MTPKFVILHHSLTKDSETMSWQAIRNHHIYKLKWRDVGYHFGIEKIKSHAHIEVRNEIIVGRMWNDTGAHCKQNGMNRNSIGICFIGDFDYKKPSNEKWQLGLKLVRVLMETWNIPRQSIKGHREYADYKSCPGLQFSMTKFRDEL